MDLWATGIEIIIGIFTLLTMAGGAYVAMRKKIHAALAPYLKAAQAMPEMQRQLHQVTYYVTPNGGGSLPDATMRIEAGLREVKTQVCEIGGKVVLLESTSRAMLDTNPSIGTFESDATGQFIVVNRALARWLGCSKGELLGWGWLNSVDPDQVDDVRNDWRLAREEHREYRQRIRFISSVGGQAVTLEVMATPVPDNPPAKRWVGVARMVQNDKQE